jgi:ectoine hydroxylase-related dioxygenase (phytanoyl-CoA dioxygenase family)
MQSAIVTFEERGFFIQPEVVSARACEFLATQLQSADHQGAGTRRLLEQPWCRGLSSTLKQHAVLSQLLPFNAVAVQCTLFAKTRRKNWAVSPHQDLSVPVAARVESPLCSGWSEKEGCLFTQPPAEVLSSLVAVRVHIDACDSDSGPLTVVPGSHKVGRVASSELIAAKRFEQRRACLVPRGGVLVMRPLLIHASSKAASSQSRRVLHFLFGPPLLPLGLRWPDIVQSA